MTGVPIRLYLIAIGASALISFALTPLVRLVAIKMDWVDHPSSAVKTHKVPTPALGGVAIFFGFTLTLVLLRFLTQFPTGTLRSLRGLIAGSALVFLLGVVDDLRKPAGLHFKPKFAVQLVATAIIMAFGLRIKFITPDYLAMALTAFWVVGITNALNIIDIMDGLSASQAAIAAVVFLMISMPSEELYVNFASAALAGATIGFLPWNFSTRFKIFMGDSGALTLGFCLAAISLGTRYSDVNDLGVFAPLLILAVPIYDTLFVMYLRLRKGHSPFLGSKDHFALRLERMGYSRRRIVFMAASGAAFLGFCAFLVTQLPLTWALGVYAVIIAEILVLSEQLAKVSMT